MRKQMKGLGFYAIVTGIILLALYMSSGFDNMDSNSYNYTNFISDLEDNKVTSIDIYPNEETPTGKVVVVVNNQKKTFNETDVDAVAKMLKDQNVHYTVHDIEKPSWF